MEAISAVGIFSASVYVLLLFNKKGRSYSDNVLILWMFLFVVHLTLPLMIAMGNRFFIEKVDGLDIGLYTLHITFLYYYSLSLAKGLRKFEPKHLLLLIPTLLIYLIQKPIDANVELFHPIVDRYFFGENHLFHLTGVVFLNLCFCSYFCSKFFRILSEHRKKIGERFSFSDNIDLRWLKNVNIAAMAFTALAIILLSGLLKGMLNGESINNIYFSSISVLVVVMGYLGYQQKVIFTQEDRETKKEDKKALTPDPPKEQNTESKEKATGKVERHEEANNLVTYMEKQKPFLDPKLSIGMVANHLGVHSHQLSKLINQHFGKNFFEFVNNYRVEEFKRLVSDPKNKNFSILGLALDAGFNSKATFNRIFKNSTDQTPSQFRDNFKF